MATTELSERMLKKLGVEEWPYQMQLVPISDLIVDDSYQRPIHEAFVKNCVNDFRPELVGAVDLADRTTTGKSRYAILDGQQRVEVLRALGLRTVHGAIYHGMSLADEAGFFYRKNKDRRTMPGYYSFRARVVSGDEQAQRLVSVVENNGFMLSTTTNHREEVGSISALEDVMSFETEVREECLSPTLAAIRGAFYGRRSSLHGDILRGFGRVFQNYSDAELNIDTLTSALGPLGPETVLGLARDRSFGTAGRHGHTNAYQVARVAVAEYNRLVQGGSRGNKSSGRLPQSRLS